MTGKRSAPDSGFNGNEGTSKGSDEPLPKKHVSDQQIVLVNPTGTTPPPEVPAQELIPVAHKRLVLDGNPTFFRTLMNRQEIGYHRVGPNKALTIRAADINVRYLRTAMTDVLTRVLRIRYAAIGHMRQTAIDAEITTYVPYIVDVCMTALYAKLRGINRSYGQYATRYNTAPSYTKDIELPLPLALAIQEFGSFQTHSLYNNLLMLPTYPEGTLHEGRAHAVYPSAEYLTYVPTLQKLGIPLKSVDARVKTGSAWWTFKIDIVEGTADLICTIPRTHYSNMSAQLRMLFISGDEENPPQDIITIDQTTPDFGTLAYLLTQSVNYRTFLALIQSPKEEWDFGIV